MNYEHLFTPLRIGAMTVPNRLVMAPHGMVFPAGYGSGVERVIDYHVERAKGGVGLMVMSNFLTLPSSRVLASWNDHLSTTALGNLDVANDAALLPAYRRLIERVHAHGTRFVSQLNASGRQLHAPGGVGFGLPLMAPSPLPCRKLQEIPKEMTVADIEEYVATFAEAAINIREAGGDGVELFAAQGYLLSEFLSPRVNLRTDRYGGTFENRLRFLSDIVDAIRHRVGRDFVVGVRLNADDDESGGIDLAAAIRVAQALHARGDVDYLNVSGMTASRYPGWIADIESPVALFATQAGAIRAAVDGLPVCVVSRVATAAEAEAVLAAGHADLVGMARALISDPELPNKARAGREDETRYCTFSNQACLQGLDRGRGVGCVHNVAVGREAQLGTGSMRPAASPQRVAVVGGGPAGMAAARVAHARGHAVTLFERSDQLGGQNRMTARVASRRGFVEVTRWQETMLRKSDVELRLDCTVDAAMLLAMGFDAIVLATGSTPSRDGRSSFHDGDERFDAGTATDRVFTPWDVFERPQAIGARVVVVDEDPHYAGTAVAEHLADGGHAVRLVSPHLHAGSSLHVYHLPALYRRLAAKGIAVTPHVVPLTFAGRTLTMRDRFGGDARSFDDVDAVVLSIGNRADRTLFDALDGRVPVLHAIGDCLAPRQIEHAIVDGERVGWML
ncbi:MAG: FAD-dependent oxidoreductase [Burkholderiaceae bacterium]